MKKLNNKGFAITTIVYGLAIMSTMILTLVMSLLATTRADNSNLSKAIEDELNKFSKTSVIYEPADVAQEYIIPEGESGWYRIELWGAQGGGANGGLGAYTSGIIYLEEGQVLYFVVGRQGTDTTGGGSTDVRIEPLTTPKSGETRIMVAAGGGRQAGAAGGTLVGYNSTMLAPSGKILKDSGYNLEAGKTLLGYSQGHLNSQTLAVSQSGNPTINYEPTNVGVGGGGYYSSTNENYGGTSFISGYAGCKAFVKGALQANNAKYTYHKHDGSSYAAAGTDFYFVDGIMLPGVKIGNGQAKVEKVVSADNHTALPRQNAKLNNVTKVRDCLHTASNSVKNTKSISVSVNGNTMTGALAADTSKSGYTCKVLTLTGTHNVDEVAVYHDPGYDYVGHTIEVYNNNGWQTIKGVNSTVTIENSISETETYTGFHISAYQPDYTVQIPESGNYYIVPVNAESKVISGFSSSDDRANPLEINYLAGEVRQKWSIELLNEKLKSTTEPKKSWIEYKIVELTRYNALTIYRDENMEGNQLIVSTFNNLARNEPAIWQVKPMGDGTVTITSSADTFTTSKNTGNIFAQTDPSEDEYNTLVIGINNNKTQRFKLIKLDY